MEQESSEKKKTEFKYGGYDEKYDMSGIIKVGLGTLKVHNLFDPLPDFMKEADFIFSDPPCSTQNINTFYTKAERTDYQESYKPFFNRFWEVMDEIKPKVLGIELFKANSEMMIKEGQKRYKYHKVYDSMYYHQKKNYCQVVIFSDDPNVVEQPINEMDEQNIIEYLCKNIDCNCIGDVCMGQGFVGYYANKAGKKFVGTELNKKRLAVLVERINSGRLNVKK